MKKKYISLIIFIVISAAAIFLPVFISAAKNITKAETLLAKALTERTYYDYLNALNSIKVIDHKSSKDDMLAKLDTIKDEINREEIKQFNTELEELKLTSDIRLFNEMLLEINTSTLDERDKTYLTGVLSMWGQHLIFTPDYMTAMNAVNAAWSNPDADTISTAEALVQDIKSDVNREFLQEEINRLKQQQ